MKLFRQVVKVLLFFISFCFIAIFTLAILAPGNDNIPVFLVVLIPSLFLSTFIVTIKHLFF